MRTSLDETRIDIFIEHKSTKASLYNCVLFVAESAGEDEFIKMIDKSAHFIYR